MASNNRFPKSDKEVNDTEPFNFSDFEVAEENTPENVKGK